MPDVTSARRLRIADTLEIGSHAEDEDGTPAGRVPGRNLATPLVALFAAAAIELGCAPRPATREVVIRAFAFSPATDTVQAGDTVRWSNQDVVPHTATSRIGGFDSGALEAGQDWRYVAGTPGTYAYECTLHPTMRGTLVVR
jgi:plastocyanin